MWNINPDILARIDFCHNVSVENGISLSVWSMPQPLDFNENHPYTNARLMFITSDDFYSDTPGTYSLPIEGKTWLDLWLTAEELINMCGDNHHIFIEDFRQSENGENLTLDLGS